MSIVFFPEPCISSCSICKSFAAFPLQLQSSWQSRRIQCSEVTVELLLRCLCTLVCQHITVYQLERLTCCLRNAPSWNVVNRQHNGSPACAHFTEILCLCMLCCVRPSLAITVTVLFGSLADKVAKQVCISSSCPACHYCHANKTLLTACPWRKSRPWPCPSLVRSTAPCKVSTHCRTYCSQLPQSSGCPTDIRYSCVLQSVCKNETSTRPCPRLVLVCCTALVTRGLETEGLFLEEAPLELVQSLMGSFQEGIELCCAMLYWAELCCTGLCCDVLCYAVLCFIWPLAACAIQPRLVQEDTYLC